MTTRLEQALQQDLDQIRAQVLEMGGLAEGALRNVVRAMVEWNRQLAYAVILRDRLIDAHENSLDERCQKFLIRHQPAAGPLRYVYGVIKINNELERIGDYAKSIARQFLAISSMEPHPPCERVVEIANLAIPIVHSALQAFSQQDEGLARATRGREKGRQIDNLRATINAELVQLHAAGKLTSGALMPLMTMANRFERVADQGGNICEEVVYMRTGKEVRHSEEQVLRILFVDERDSCRAPMAVGIGNSLDLKGVQFSSAGIRPGELDPRTVTFMAGKEVDISADQARDLKDVTDLDQYAVIITLDEAARELSLPPGNLVNIGWEVEPPLRQAGSDEQVQAAFDRTYEYLQRHIRDLVQAIFGEHLAGAEPG